MILLARPSAAVRRLAGHKRLGVLGTPRGLPDWLMIQRHLMVCACDNDAFAGFDERRYLRMLDRITGRPVRWVAAPDVVADSAATLRLWPRWQRELAARKLPAAFVLQDGQRIDEVPWSEAFALFIGGTTRFKLRESADLVAEAKARGLWVHMGRCSTKRRIAIAVAMNCDSIDSVCTAKLPDLWVPKILRWIEQAKAQPTLGAW